MKVCPDCGADTVPFMSDGRCSSCWAKKNPRSPELEKLVKDVSKNLLDQCVAALPLDFGAAPESDYEQFPDITDELAEIAAIGDRWVRALTHDENPFPPSGPKE